MKDAVRRFTPYSSWMSAALLTFFVVSFGVFAEGKIRSQAIADNPPGICTSSNEDRQRLFVRFH